jgi:hypothetical protein
LFEVKISRNQQTICSLQMDMARNSPIMPTTAATVDATVENNPVKISTFSTCNPKERTAPMMSPASDKTV